MMEGWKKKQEKGNCSRITALSRNEQTLGDRSSRSIYFLFISAFSSSEMDGKRSYTALAPEVVETLALT
jgi:hypothetical protein